MNLTDTINDLKKSIQLFNDEVHLDCDYFQSYTLKETLTNPHYQQIIQLLTIVDDDLDHRFELLLLQFKFLHAICWRLDNSLDDYRRDRDGYYLYQKWQRNEPISPTFQDILERYILEEQNYKTENEQEEKAKRIKAELLQQLYIMDKNKTIISLSVYFYKTWKLREIIIETIQENDIEVTLTIDDIDTILFNKKNSEIQWYVKHYFLHIFEEWDNQLIYGKCPIELHAWLKFAKKLHLDLSDLFLTKSIDEVNDKGERVLDWQYCAFIGNSRYRSNQQTTSIPMLNDNEQVQAEVMYNSLWHRYLSINPIY